MDMLTGHLEVVLRGVIGSSGVQVMETWPVVTMTTSSNSTWHSGTLMGPDPALRQDATGSVSYSKHPDTSVFTNTL